MSRLALLLLTCLLMTVARAGFDSPEAFHQWFSNYYRHPEPARIAEALRYATSQHLLDKTDVSGPPVFGFLSGVVRDNPGRAAALLKSLDDLPSPQRDLVVLGVWYANLPKDQSRQLVDEALDRHPDTLKRLPILAQDPADLLTLDPEQAPWVLDAFWGRFSATGRQEPVLRIISVLPWMHESKKAEIMASGKDGVRKMIIAGAAQWSLTSNAKQHPAVLKMCEQEAGRQPEPVASMLKAIVLKARGLPDASAFPPLKAADKPLEGLVLVTDDLDWQAKWNTPEDTVPNFNRVTRAKRGQKLVVLIFVARPGMDADRNVKVDCDLRFLMPDGREALKREGAVCLSGQLKGAQESLYLSMPVVNFVGEDNDPSGTWRFEAVLHDRLRGTDLPVSSEFTLE